MKTLATLVFALIVNLLVAQEPVVNKCNTRITYIIYLNGADKPDTIVAYAYVPVDSTVTKPIANK